MYLSGIESFAYYFAASDGVTRKRLVIRIPNPFKNRKPRESNEAKNEEAVDGQATSLEEYLHLKDALTVNKKKRGQRTKRSIFGFSQDCWQATFESRKDKGIADGYGLVDFLLAISVDLL